MKIFQFFFLKRFQPKDEENQSLKDPYIEIGDLIKRSRLEQNLSIKELSNISKIPFSTIHAIENNIKEIIPRYPFTRSILLKLEKCLYLKEYQLTNLAKKEKIYKDKIHIKNIVINKFDIVGSWHGNIIYLLILIISIFVLNNYYLRTRIIEFEFIENNTNNTNENSN